MEEATIEYLKVAFPELTEDDSKLLRTLLKQFTEELQAGGPRPRWSIMKNLVQMTESQITQAIKVYETALAPKPVKLVEAVDAQAGPDRSAVEELSKSKPASNGDPGKSDGQSGSPDNKYQKPKASNTSARDAHIKRGKEEREEEEEEEDEEEDDDYDDDDDDDDDDYQTWWSEANNAGEVDWQWSGSDRVLYDCRAHFAQIERRQSLLSQVGISLSRVSRDYLESRGIKLKRFLGGYSEEFAIEGSLDGRDSVTHYPLKRSDRGGSEGVLRECRAHLEKQPERQQLLSKLGASLSASARACLEQKSLKLKRFLMKYSPEFTIDECDDGRDTVTLTNRKASKVVGKA